MRNEPNDPLQYFQLAPDGATICWRARTPDMFPRSVDPVRHCMGWNARFEGRPVALTVRGRVRLQRKEYAVSTLRAALGGARNINDRTMPDRAALVRWQRSQAVNPSPVPDTILRLAYYATGAGENRVIRHRPRDLQSWASISLAVGDLSEPPAQEIVDRWNARFAHAFVAFHNNRTALMRRPLHYAHIAAAVGAPFAHRPAGGHAKILPLPRDALRAFFTLDDAGRVVGRSLGDVVARTDELHRAGVLPHEMTDDAAQFWIDRAEGRTLAELLADAGRDALPLYGAPVTLADVETALRD